MFKALKPLIILVLVCCAFIQTNAQQTFTSNDKLQLNKFQDTLVNLSEEIFATKDNLSRFERNTSFVKKLINTLKINNSFDFDFDSLKRVTILKSPDNSFRLITWYVPTDEGTYRFYGTIQMATPNGSLKMFPLTDHTEKIMDSNAITTHKNWLGARYYDMMPIVGKGKQPYWILLGWKGNNQKTTKKVIEVLSFENGEPIFGKNIFETTTKGDLKKRIIFEYNKLNAMTLQFERKLNLIVFDHLAPFEPNMVGNYEYYAGDLTFDAYKINWGKLEFLEDISLKNDPSINDNFYVKPVKASTVVINGKN